MSIPNLRNVYRQPVKGNFETDEYCFFWAGPFSNWHPSVFKYDGVTYNCAEQGMMHQKAILFGDLESADLIMKTDDPKLQKALGRGVKGYVESEWVDKRYDIVYGLLHAKFDQNIDLADILLATDDLCIVEASPYDKVWGIAMGVDKYPQILDKRNWKGENLLGSILMDVRYDFQQIRYYESVNDEVMGEMECDQYSIHS
ncbi:GTP cyclohydrolase II [Stenotrophomonas phage RAS14]